MTNKEIKAYNTALRAAAEIVRRCTAIPESALRNGTGVRDRTVVDGEYMIDAILKKRMPEAVPFQTGELFGNCKRIIDHSLPPHIVEMRGANVVQLDTRTGEITVRDKP